MLQLFPELSRYRALETRPGGGDHLEGRARRKDGKAFPVELSLPPTVVEDQRLVIAIVRDISLAKAQERRLRHQAVHDALTGLPNRMLLKDRLAQALRSAARAADPLAAAAARSRPLQGDQRHARPPRGAICCWSSLPGACRDCIRDSDTIARLGGDEFAILLPPPSDVERAWSVSGRIVHAVQQPFEVAGGLHLEVGVSIGIALFPEHAADEARLLQCADVAMYAAKKGAGPVQLYDRDQDRNTVRHLTLTGALRQAIEGGELTLDFQPKLDLPGRHHPERRGARPLASPGAGRDPLRGVHPARRADRADPALHPLELRCRAGAARLVEDRRHRHQRRGQPLGLQPARREAAGDRRRPAAQVAGRSGPAHAGAHRERGHARPRGRPAQPVPPARSRPAAVDRRLRHRLLVALGPAAPAAAPR